MGRLGNQREPVGPRLWPRIDYNGPKGCWLWLGAKTGKGYGAINVDGKQQKVHNVVFRLLNGSIAAGMVLDHMCQVPACANPLHLQEITPAHNSALAGWRKTHCPKNHEYTEENTYSYRGMRHCKMCRLLTNRKLKGILPENFRI